MKTSAGNDWQAALMGNAAATGAGTGALRAADYIAVSEDATAPSVEDVELIGELTGFGFARKAATYAHTTGAPNYTLSATFTSTDTIVRVIRKLGVFNALLNGTLVFVTFVTNPPAMQDGDSITFTETINL